MARSLRIELAGGFYHVMAHGNGRLWLFRNDGDRKQFLKLLGVCVFKYKVVIHAFVLMTTHIHLLIETPLPNMSHFMRKFLSDYGLYYNKRYRRKGSVFKGRYGSRLIQKDNYYLMAVKYLYNNPVKVRLVKNPYKYRWSSLYYLLNKKLAKEISWYKIDDVMEMVGGKRGLFDLMASEPEELPIVYKTFIVDKEWADEIISKNYDRINNEISNVREMKRGAVDPERIIGLVAQVYKISNKTLIAGGHREAKRVCLYVLYKNMPLGAKEIGDIFQMSKWAVFKTVHRMEDKKRTASEIRTIKLLKEKMSNVQKYNEKCLSSV